METKNKNRVISDQEDFTLVLVIKLHKNEAQAGVVKMLNELCLHLCYPCI